MKVFSSVLAAVVVSLACGSAQADVRDFTLSNNTAWTIAAVYIAAPGAPDWGPEVLGPSLTLGPSRQTAIGFTGGKSCLNDIRVVFNGNVDINWKGIDFCKISSFKVWYDFNTKQYKAETL
jgi:hypothetical protein